MPTSVLSLLSKAMGQALIPLDGRKALGVLPTEEGLAPRDDTGPPAPPTIHFHPFHGSQHGSPPTNAETCRLTTRGQVRLSIDINTVHTTNLCVDSLLHTLCIGPKDLISEIPPSTFVSPRCNGPTARLTIMIARVSTQQDTPPWLQNDESS